MTKPKQKREKAVPMYGVNYVCDNCHGISVLSVKKGIEAPRTPVDACPTCDVSGHLAKHYGGGGGMLPVRTMGAQPAPRAAPKRSRP